MEIRKLFGQQDAAVRADNTKSQRDVNNQEPQEAAEKAVSIQPRSGQDVVSVSPLAKQLSQISGILDDDENKRGARVAELKQAVQDGSYSVSSTDVAGAIISYASDVPPLQGA